MDVQAGAGREAEASVVKVELRRGNVLMRLVGPPAELCEAIERLAPLVGLGDERSAVSGQLAAEASTESAGQVAHAPNGQRSTGNGPTPGTPAYCAKSPTSAHHWQLAKPTNGVTPGVCRDCDAERDFPADVDVPLFNPASVARRFGKKGYCRTCGYHTKSRRHQEDCIGARKAGLAAAEGAEVEEARAAAS